MVGQYIVLFYVVPAVTFRTENKSVLHITNVITGPLFKVLQQYIPGPSSVIYIGQE